MDLERLHDVALRYGIDRREEYAQLNPGQQRMNLGNILRRVVPEQVYASIGHPPDASPQSESSLQPVPTPPLVTEPIAQNVLHQSSVRELLSLYGDIMEQLRERGVVRTGNSPVGDYAEILFANAFGWALEANSASGHDATDPQGLRYQIKGRRLGAPGASRQLGAIRRLNEQTFDFLAAVLFDSRFKVSRAILIPHANVTARARRAEHTNSWTFILDDRIWNENGVRDVSAEIAVAASRL